MAQVGEMETKTMKTIYSPNNIDVLLHCYSQKGPHPRLEALAVQDSIMEFISMGVVEVLKREKEGTIYKTTPLGDAWVQALCNVPPPRMAFIDQNGAVLTGK